MDGLDQNGLKTQILINNYSSNKMEVGNCFFKPSANKLNTIATIITWLQYFLVKGYGSWNRTQLRQRL